MPEPAGTVLLLPAIITAAPSAVAGVVVLGSMTGGADSLPPVVGNFSPPSGSTIDAADPVFFDVTDNTGLFKRVLVLIHQGDEADEIATELVHDGEQFWWPYAAQSLRENIPGGFRYRVRRSGGWLADVVSVVFAYDNAGNEAVS